MRRYDLTKKRQWQCIFGLGTWNEFLSNPFDSSLATFKIWNIRRSIPNGGNKWVEDGAFHSRQAILLHSHFSWPYERLARPNLVKNDFLHRSGQLGWTASGLNFPIRGQNAILRMDIMAPLLALIAMVHHFRSEKPSFWDFPHSVTLSRFNSCNLRNLRNRCSSHNLRNSPNSQN